jgi:hypothetical protein
MPRFECKEWIEIVGAVLISKLEAPAPNSWLAGFGRKEVGAREW